MPPRLHTAVRVLLPGSLIRLLAFAVLVVPALAAGQEAPRVASPEEAERIRQAQLADYKRRYEAWEKVYADWLEEQSRLDDGFMFSAGTGVSPVRVNTRFSGGNRRDFPDVPPFPNVNFRGIGATVDLRMGWLVENDPYLEEYWYGDTKLHDQLYLTLDLITRSSPYPQLRFVKKDDANEGSFFRPVYMLDLMMGVGMTYRIMPYETSVSTTIGVGLLGMQGDSSAVRTEIGPAFNARIAQEWRVRENWRSGFAITYGFVQSTNPPKTVCRFLNNQNTCTESYQENYGSHLFSIQWVNTFTPPKYRRGLPPPRPQFLRQ